MWDEFKKFAFKGNVVDMAVGVVIGAAFGSIVKSLVDHLVMPPIGILTGGVDFSQLYVVLKGPTTPGNYATPEDMVKAGAVLLRYGLVVNTVLSFLLIAVAVFALIQVMNKAMRKQAADPTTKDCPHCCMSIPIKAARCGHCTQPIAA